jgi:hypothetical protein
MASEKPGARASQRSLVPGKRASYSSTPLPNEPNLRRLGQSGGERPLRAQLVIGGILALILVAVPLYLLRRPERAPTPPASEASASLPAFGSINLGASDAGPPEDDVRLGPVQRVRCGASAQHSTSEGCEPLPAFERALARGIRSHPECAPRAGREGSINYVLEIDFEQRRLNAFAGRSGTWRGRQARSAAKCVLATLPPMNWPAIKHQYRYYAIAFLATYPTPNPLDEMPVFE